MTEQKDPAHRGEATKHWVNACLMQLICITALLLCVGGAIYASFIHECTADAFVRLMIDCLPCAAFAAFCVIRSYDIFGRVTITRDHPALKATLCRTLVYRLPDLKDIQIVESLLSVGRQCWVVMGQEPVPPRYVRRINTLPITPRCLRMQYTPSLDARLPGCSRERRTRPSPGRRRLGHGQLRPAVLTCLSPPGGASAEAPPFLLHGAQSYSKALMHSSSCAMPEQLTMGMAVTLCRAKYRRDARVTSAALPSC